MRFEKTSARGRAHTWLSTDNRIGVLAHPYRDIVLLVTLPDKVWQYRLEDPADLAELRRVLDEAEEVAGWRE